MSRSEDAHVVELRRLKTLLLLTTFDRTRISDNIRSFEPNLPQHSTITTRQHHSFYFTRTQYRIFIPLQLVQHISLDTQIHYTRYTTALHTTALSLQQ